MNKRFPFILMTVIPLVLSSCYLFGPADGAFRVSGTVISETREPLENCSMELQDKRGVVLGGGPRRTESEIDILFVVAPYKADYWLLLSCPDYDTKKIPVSYGKDASPMKPLKLGEIVMKEKN